MRISDDELRDVDKIIIIACGTAFYAGLVAKYAIEHWTRIPCEVELAHEFRYRDPILTRYTLVVAISQSGETADTLMAIRHARQQRSKVLAICNTNGSTIPRESDAVIYTHAGPEIGVASTKGFLTQLVACYLLGLYLAQVRGTTYGDEIARRGRRARRRCPATCSGSSTTPSTLYDLAAELQDAKSVLFLGRHAGFPVALEGALKLKELAYIHAEGFAAGELKHGPIALIEHGLPVFCVVPPRGRDQLHDKMVSAIQEIRARGARTIVLAEEGDADVAPYADDADPAARGCSTLLQPVVGRRTRCSCSRASWRPCSATTSTSRATSPSPSRSSRPRSWRSSASASTWSTSRASSDVPATYAGARASGCSPRPRSSRPLASLAARFAAKEALAKALGAPGGLALARRRGGHPTRRGGRCFAICAAPSPPAPPSSASTTSTSRSPTTPASPSAVVVLES